MAREKTLARRERGELETFEPWNSFREMERMFSNFFRSPLSMVQPPRWLAREAFGELIPEVDLKETDHELILSAVIPGLEKDDFDINVTEDSITVNGERKTEEEKPGERFHIRQQTYGNFHVSYSLPSEVKPDDVKAIYKNGVLEVIMPKAEVTEAHKVKVEVGEGGHEK